MNALPQLWLPILLSAVVVFVISSLVHMAIKWHAKDYGRLENEDAIRDAIRNGKVVPGRYVLPYCGDMKDMASDAMKKKYAEGPVGHLTIIPNGQPNMGKYLAMWFILCLFVSAVAALLAIKTLPIDPAWARTAGKLTAAISFVGYGFGTLQESIWMGRPWSTTVKYLLDAALYAAGTGAVFYWMWH